MKKYAKSPPSPAEMYEKYIVTSTFVPWTPILVKFAAPQPGMHVLDLACGTGIVARHVAPLIGKTGKVTGVDISPDMLRVAQNLPALTGASISWHQADGASTGLPDDSFDLVICQQGLQFFQDRQAGVKEMARVLKKGGRAVVAVWKSLDHHPVWKAVCESESQYLNVPIHVVSTPWTLGDPEELKSLFVKAEFDSIDIITKSANINYPSPELFIQLMMGAALSFMPDLATDQGKKVELIEVMTKDTRSILQKNTTDKGLIFPMTSNIVIAHL